MKHTKYIATLAILALSLATSVSAATGDTSTGASTATATTTSATSTADALNVIGAPKLVSRTATGVTLEWSKVALAKAYIVKYSKTSVAEAFKAGKTNAVYDNETDRVTATGTTVKDLKPNTSYYFAVVALDADDNESATNSEELAVLAEDVAAAGTGSLTPTPAPIATATGSDFKIAGVTVINDKTFSVDFSSSLSSAPVTLKLTKSANMSNVPVANVVSGKTPNQVIVTLEGTMDASSSYSLVVISAKDSNGNSISQGLNAIREFTTTANIVKTAAATATGTTGSGTALNAAPPQTELPATVTKTATGTQENILLALAALLALVIVVSVRRSKKA